MSTVAISLRDIFGVAAECEVIFNPLDTPYTDGVALTVSGSRSVRLDDQGLGSAVLQPGRYSVRFSGLCGNSDALSIVVPNDNATYPLTTLAGEVGVVTAPPDYLRLGSLSAAGRALLTAADAAAQRVELGLGGPEVWPLFEKHYFTYDPDADNAGPALLAQLKASCRGPNPPYVIPPEFSAFTTATSHYPLFAIMWGDNADLGLLMTPAGNPIPCVIGMATLNGDLNLAGVVDSMSFQALTYYFRAQMLAGDLNGDGVVDSGDFAYLTELSAN